VAISDAQIELKGQFIKVKSSPPPCAWPSMASPAAERVNRAEGDLSRSLAQWTAASTPVASSIQPGLELAGFGGLRAPPRATANVLTLSPQTRLSYRYSMSALGSLAEAWSSLPGEPVILVAGGALERTSFDSAWRLGVALERSARRAQVRALPQVGDSLSLPASRCRQPWPKSRPSPP
jgi:hypothetical protein